MCDRFPRKFDVQTSYNITFVVNIKFPRETYHTIEPLTEELYCLNSICRYMKILSAHKL